jgi:hypothetical protein
VFDFYEFHARHGVPIARALVDETRVGRGSFKPSCTASREPSRVDGLADCGRTAACRPR